MWFSDIFWMGAIWLIWLYLGMYFSVPNVVKWGIPEKILQNAVQMCWPCVNRTPQSKLMTKSQLGPQILDTKTTFGHQLLILSVITMGIWGKDVIWQQFLNGGLYWHKVNTSLQHFASSVNTIQPVGTRKGGGEGYGPHFKDTFLTFQFWGHYSWTRFTFSSKSWAKISYKNVIKLLPQLNPTNITFFNHAPTVSNHPHQPGKNQSNLTNRCQ